MIEEYRNEIIRLLGEITEERDLWLILHFTQLRAGRK